MYRYETHLHTSPVSKCGKATVRESVEFYKQIGYDGVFLTNHFIGGNINKTTDMSYEECVEFFFSDCEEGERIGKEIGFKVFYGAEITYKGTDFLIYGLDKQWYLDNPQIVDMKMTEKLAYMAEAGALIIQAHPYREAGYIDHIRLFPRSVHGVEVYNASQKELANKMAKLYAENYDLVFFAGSDNHGGAAKSKLGGIQTETPIESVEDFVTRVKNREIEIFELKNPLIEE